MCDVVFITPSLEMKLECESIGTLQLATILKRKGINCKILPFYGIGSINHFDDFLFNTIQILKKYNPRIVSFYCRCDTYHIVLRLAQHIKSHLSNIYIVCGGPQADITAVDTIRQVEYIDFICCGEGEETIFPFFSSLLQGKPALFTFGLVYRLNGDVIKNPLPPLIQNLDILPAPDYSILDYIDINAIKKQIFMIDVGRGCPFGCTFCSTNRFWGRKYRLKSPHKIIEEVCKAYNEYGVTFFQFSHDMFTLDRKKVVEICKLISDSNLPIRWNCSARLDCVDADLIDIMADSGLNSIYFGIETGSARMQKIIKKRLNLDRTIEILSYMKSKGLRSTTSFIYGFPEETEEDISQTLSLVAQILKLRSTRVQMHLCAFMVGTELTENYGDEMTPVETYSDQTGDYAIEECKGLIQMYPNLFQHLMEYKTDLRTKLKYLSLFIQVWHSKQPAYQYISEHYDKENLIQMYYDFIEINAAILTHSEKLDRKNQLYYVICHDKLYKKFVYDECYDILEDTCRLIAAVYSDEVQNGGSNTDIYCVDPSCLSQERLLQEYPRCLARVTTRNKRYYTEIISID